MWTQVHQGHLPLWNPYSVLGMPLAFNWESAPLSLPALIGYLFPVRLAYTAHIVVTLVVAGTGVYVLGKVLRLGRRQRDGGDRLRTGAAHSSGISGGRCPRSCPGPAGFLPPSSWSCAAKEGSGDRASRRGNCLRHLCGRSRGRALARAVGGRLRFGDAPDPTTRTRRFGSHHPTRRGLGAFGTRRHGPRGATHPPGLQLAKGSNRTVVGPALLPKGLPPKELVHLIFQGFDGLPLLHSQWFGLSAYEATCVYVGVIVLVLAATALVLRWRRPEVRSFALVAVVMGLLVFVPPLVSVLDNSGARIYWIFAMTPMVLAVAVLSGIGMDILVKSHAERSVRRALGIGFTAMAVVFGIIWLLTRRGITPSQVNIRSHSFIWPTIAVVAGLRAVWTCKARWKRWRLLSPGVGVRLSRGRCC